MQVGRRQKAEVAEGEGRASGAASVQREMQECVARPRGRAKAARYALWAYTYRSWCQLGGASTPENTKSQRDRANATKDRTINRGDMGLSRVE